MELKQAVFVKIINADDGITNQRNYFISCDKGISEKLLAQIAEDTDVWLPDVEPTANLPKEIKGLILEKLS